MTAPRLAIVHDWLVQPGGAESVLGLLRDMYPEADVFCVIDHMAEADRVALGIGETHTSMLQRIPGIERHYRSFLPLMPAALRSLDVSGYDMVLSVSHAVAKGVRTHARQLHLCYCLSPMRYAWDLRESYLRASGLDGPVRGPLARFLLERLRRWDAANSRSVDHFATLSHFIAERIRRAYGRESAVIYPPVDTGFYTPGGARDDYYLTASRFVQYKRVDLIAQAMAGLPDRRLLIVGDGPDQQKIRAVAGRNVELLGRRSRHELRDLLRGARAFLFAAEEDFGIAPVEAQACGTPVIAFGRGGARETVLGPPAPGATGIFFDEQTPDSLAAAIRKFELIRGDLTADQCRANALRFDTAVFVSQMRDFLAQSWDGFRANRD